jgi:hypothetical protein
MFTITLDASHWATPVPRRWALAISLLWPLQRHGVPLAGRLYHAAWKRAAPPPAEPCDCAGCSL